MKFKLKRLRYMLVIYVFLKFIILYDFVKFIYILNMNIVWFDILKWYYRLRDKDCKMNSNNSRYKIKREWIFWFKKIFCIIFKMYNIKENY